MPAYKHKAIIFLDVDGVLNNMTTVDTIKGFVGIDSRNVEVLKQLVEMFEAEIVLSSSWKTGWSKNKEEQDEFANRLDDVLAEYGLSIIDKTYEKNIFRRGEGIRNWLAEHGPVENYIILDDDSFDFKEQGISRHWVQTSSYSGNPFGGLGERHIRYIKKNINRFSCNAKGKTEENEIDREER